MVNLLPEDIRDKKNEKKKSNLSKSKKLSRPSFKMHVPSASNSTTKKVSVKRNSTSSKNITKAINKKSDIKHENISMRPKFGKSKPTIKVRGAKNFASVSSSRPKLMTPPKRKTSVAIEDFNKSIRDRAISRSLERGGFSVNLVPEDTMRIVKEDFPNLLKKYILMIVITFGILMSGWWGLSHVQLKTFTNIQVVKNDTNEIRNQIYQFKTQTNEIAQLRKRYDITNVLLDNHIYWTEFFDKLEKYTIPEVYYTNFSMRSLAGSKVTLNARAKDISSAARQLVAFQEADDFIKDVTISGFSAVSASDRRTSQIVNSNGIISFDISLVLSPEVFFRK